MLQGAQEREDHEQDKLAAQVIMYKRAESEKRLSVDDLTGKKGASQTQQQQQQQKDEKGKKRKIYREEKDDKLSSLEDSLGGKAVKL